MIICGSSFLVPTYATKYLFRIIFEEFDIKFLIHWISLEESPQLKVSDSHILSDVRELVSLGYS